MLTGNSRKNASIKASSISGSRHLTNPIDGNMRCHIHFGFPDGSKLKQAFSYEWRLWGLPELRELLDEAGFSKVTVYWEGNAPKTGEGTNIYTPATVGDADPGWVCFLVAEK